MSLIGKNIRKIRSVKGLSQSAFAEMFDLTRASVGAYEEGRAEPKLDTIITIANHFGISLDLIVKKELTVNQLYRFDIFKTDIADTIVTEDEAAYLGKDVAVIRQVQLVDYLKNTDNEAFVDSLDKLKLDASFFSVDRIFQLGNSDHVMYSHVIDGIDYVFANKCNISDNTVESKGYFLAVAKERYYFGRGKLSKSEVRLFRSGEDISVDRSDLLELWKVEKVISSLTESNMDWMARMDALEKRISRLEKLQ